MARDDYGSVRAPFALTRHDRDRERDVLSAAMRDAWDYFSAGDDDRPKRDLSDVTRGILGDNERAVRDMLGLFGGAGIVGLTAGLMGNANIGNSGIPMALIPAGVAYGLSAFDVLPGFSQDFRNIGHGALAMGLGLWALSLGIRIQSQRQQSPAIVAAGAPPSHDAVGSAPPANQPAQQHAHAQMGNHPPPPAYAAWPQHAQPGMLPAPMFNPNFVRRGPLSEPEMIAVMQQY